MKTWQYKCEQVPVVGGCVYSGGGVKDTADLSTSFIWMSGCRGWQTQGFLFSLELIFQFHLI